MRTPVRGNVRSFGILFLALTLFVTGDQAQTVSAPGKPLSPDLQRRVEIALRTNASLPPDADVFIGPRTPSELPGYDVVSIIVKTSDGKSSSPLQFLISTDDKTFAQFNKFDISRDPRSMIPDVGRPSRGGPENAPVLIVGFDDLQCPYCARLHGELFPAITQRYGNQVHIVYRDFPNDYHPWAMRAAVDVNCLGALSPTGYWDLVDYIHAHFQTIGVDPNARQVDLGTALKQSDVKDLAKDTPSFADNQLDALTRDEARRQHADTTKLNACIAKQDTGAIIASYKLGESLNIGGTPALFINGMMVGGAQPLDIIYKTIDNALHAAGQTPPPPYVPPAPPAAKPGN